MCVTLQTSPKTLTNKGPVSQTLEPKLELSTSFFWKCPLPCGLKVQPSINGDSVSFAGFPVPSSGGCLVSGAAAGEGVRSVRASHEPETRCRGKHSKGYIMIVLEARASRAHLALLYSAWHGVRGAQSREKGQNLLPNNSDINATVAGTSRAFQPWIQSTFGSFPVPFWFGRSGAWTRVPQFCANVSSFDHKTASVFL